VEALIHRLLGGQAKSLAARRVSARAVVTGAKGDWTLRMTTAAGKTPGQRTLHGSSCDELADAAALIVALAFDPEAVAKAGARVELAEIATLPGVRAVRTAPESLPALLPASVVALTPAPESSSPTEPQGAGGAEIYVSPVAWTAFGVGAAGLLVGSVTGSIALSQSDALSKSCEDGNCTPERESERDRIRVIAHASTASFIVAGAGAATGLVLVLTSDAPESGSPPGGSTDSAVAVQPVLGIGNLGVVGRF